MRWTGEAVSGKLARSVVVSSRRPSVDAAGNRTYLRPMLEVRAMTARAQKMPAARKCPLCPAPLNPARQILAAQPSEGERALSKAMTEDLSAPSYHDLFVTAPEIERQSIARLGYGLRVTCSRISGWQLWSHYSETGRYLDGNPRLLAGEYDGPDKWLILDIRGHLIVNSRDRVSEESGV